MNRKHLLNSFWIKWRVILGINLVCFCITDTSIIKFSVEIYSRRTSEIFENFLGLFHIRSWVQLWTYTHKYTLCTHFNVSEGVTRWRENCQLQNLMRHGISSMKMDCICKKKHELKWVVTPCYISEMPLTFKYPIFSTFLNKGRCANKWGWIESNFFRKRLS